MSLLCPLICPSGQDNRGKDEGFRRTKGGCSPVYLSSQWCRKVDFIDRTGHQGRRRTAYFGGRRKGAKWNQGLDAGHRRLNLAKESQK